MVPGDESRGNGTSSVATVPKPRDCISEGAAVRSLGPAQTFPLTDQFTCALQRGQQRGLIARAAVELRLLRQLLVTVWLFVAQSEVAAEAELQLARRVRETSNSVRFSISLRLPAQAAQGGRGGEPICRLSPDLGGRVSLKSFGQV